MATTLYIGNKNYSSWSLRPWLCLRWAGIDFQEQLIRLDQPGYGKQQIAEVLAVAGSGRVPALNTDGVRIWDSLAIAEWANEAAPAAQLWPADPVLRGLARSVTAEMHAGFSGMRRDLSMNIHRRCAPPSWPDDTLADIARVVAIWTELRQDHAKLGPWLLGLRSIADAFYTPVATRFRSYGVALPAAAAAYADTLLADADFRAWEADAIPDSWDVSGYSVIDRLYV